MIIKTIGNISRIISFSGVPVSPDTVKSSMPYGGVESPIMRFSTMTTPKWTRSIPNWLRIGIMIGVNMSCMGVVSRKQPRISKAMLRITSMTYLFWVNPSKNVAITLGICSILTI